MAIITTVAYEIDARTLTHLAQAIQDNEVVVDREPVTGVVYIQDSSFDIDSPDDIATNFSDIFGIASNNGLELATITVTDGMFLRFNITPDDMSDYDGSGSDFLTNVVFMDTLGVVSLAGGSDMMQKPLSPNYFTDSNGGLLDMSWMIDMYFQDQGDGTFHIITEQHFSGVVKIPGTIINDVDVDGAPINQSIIITGSMVSGVTGVGSMSGNTLNVRMFQFDGATYTGQKTMSFSNFNFTNLNGD